MAKSTRTAQSPISCQLCKNEVVIKWKCTNCELLLCEHCKMNIHSRFKSSEKHRVVSIKDFGNDITDKIKALETSEVISSVFNTYQTELSCVHKIICRDDDVVFLFSNSDTQDCNCIKAKLRKNSIKVLHRFEIECQDFDVNRENELVFAPCQRTELKAVSSTGDVKTLLKTFPMMILGIHINKHGELVLGLREQGPKYPVTDFCTRQVVILNTDYQRKATFEYDDFGKKLFSYAAIIESDSKENIYVVDFINDSDHGQIVCLDMNGRKKFSYKGNSILNTTDIPFIPYDIAITSGNVLLITDSNAIHALTENGEMCGLQSTKNLGIYFPHSLAFDSEGFLLIGCSSAEGDETRTAKLHAVKISL